MPDQYYLVGKRMKFGPEDLPDFVIECDRRGGPGNRACQDYWEGFEYRSNITVDQSLDPFSDAYVNQQLALYHEISRKHFDQSVNEHTTLDVDKHVGAINPYDHGSPGVLAEHIERLSRAIRLGNPSLGSRILDMGCGWGLSSEIAAYCGLSVEAIDVNSDFVDLVNRRSTRLGLNITARQSTFDDFSSDQTYEMVLFYECFHHALKPWELLSHLTKYMSDGGRIVMAGEPINQLWWKNWGMRLDPLSIYCIHKFGWLESGWSQEFLAEAFQRAGLEFRIHPHLEGNIGPVVVGTKPCAIRIGAAEIVRSWIYTGWYYDVDYLTSTGESTLSIPAPDGCNTATFGFFNFRGKPITMSIEANDRVVVERVLQPGRTEVALDAKLLKSAITLKGEIWQPSVELKTSDSRSLSFHLGDVAFR